MTGQRSAGNDEKQPSLDLPDRRQPGPRTWRCDVSIGGTDVHLRPRNDHIWHSLDDDCPCGPEAILGVDLATAVPSVWIYIHHALDNRARQLGGHTPTADPCGRRGDDGTCRSAA